MTLNHKGQLSMPLGTTADYDPRYSLTEKTKVSLESIDRERYAFDHFIIDLKYQSWLKRRAFIRSGHHTLRIEGNKLTEDQVAEILDNPGLSASEGVQEQEQVRNWNQAMQFVDTMSAQQDIPLTTLLIRHIHQLMLGPNDRINTPGEYRRGEARVRHPVTRKPVYTGPPSGDVPDLMDQLGRWLNNGASAAHPVLAAGIAHLRFVEIHPFSDGNGRTARALTTLMLQRSNYAFNRLFALERYFDFDLLKYCDAIGTTVGGSFEEGRDMTGWLEYFAFALSVEVTMASDAIIDLRRQMELWHSVLSQKGYGARHRDILAYAVINNGIRPRDIIKFAGISGVTASDDLKRLVNAKLLMPSGRSRSRVYRPSDEFWKEL